MSSKTPTIQGFLTGKFGYQATIDYIEHKLHKQGKESYDKDINACMYRGPKGRKCGIGHIIPDSQYKLNMEYAAVDELRDYITVDNADSKRARFLMRCQIAHDKCSSSYTTYGKSLSKKEFRSEMHKNFGYVRKDFDLNPYEGKQ